MIKKRSRKIPVNLFFLELIIVLLFFSVSGAVILKMFATAHIMAEKSSLNERSALCVQSVSELYAVSGDMDYTAYKFFGAGGYTSAEDGSIIAWLDEDMTPLVTEDGKKYYGRVRMEMNETATVGKCGRLSEMTVKLFSLSSGEELLYSHTCSAYIPDFERKVTQ